VDLCHRFDFHRPTVEQIASVVRRAAAAEQIEIPPEAVAALARAATGSFRDALGTLEQIVTYGAGAIALEDVLAVLGVADARLLEATVDAVAAGDSPAALRALEECAEQGRDAASFASDLEVHLRELMVVQTLGEVPAELSLTPEADAALRAQAERVEHATVVRTLELIGEAMEAVRAGADPRTRVELALVKASRPEVDGSMRALLARIERLEQGRDRGSAAGSGDASHTAQAASVDAASAPPARSPEAAPASPPRPSEAAALAGAASSAVAAPAAAAAPLPVETAPVPGGGTRGLEAITALWPAVVDLVRGENALLGALIAEARPVAAQGEDLTLAFAASAQFLKKKAEDPANRMTVGEALRAVTGERWRLSYELREQPAGEQAAAERSEEEWVRRFIDEFDAEELDDWEPTRPADAGEGGHAAQVGGGDAPAMTGNEKGS